MSIGFSASDCIALPQFTWQVYKTCRDASDDFKDLASDVESMHEVLKEVQTLVENHVLDDASKIRLATVLKGCHDVLKTLENKLEKYKSLGTNKKRMWDRLRWGTESVGDVRARLVFRTTILTSSLAACSLLSADRGAKAQVVSVHEYSAPLPLDTLSPPGIRLVCLRCMILKLRCHLGNPCRARTENRSAVYRLPCRQGPLKMLAKNLIPPFYWSSTLERYRNPSVQQMVMKAVGECPITMRWGLIKLDVSLGTSLNVMNAEISLKARTAMVTFQQTFPDEHYFRTKLIDLALKYEMDHVESISLLQQARQFLILSLLVAHDRIIYYPVVPETPLSARQDIYNFARTETTHTLSVLLEKNLENLLETLQTLLSARKRTNWPAICFALSLMFFAAESMQVDIYIYLGSSKAPMMCEAMEMRSILVLAELFKASTAGFDPLCLDWTKEQNADLVENEEAAIISLKALQNLSHDYWTFLNDRRIIQFDHTNTDCFTGKLVSRILSSVVCAG